MKKTIETHWELWVYDVWGNKNDGYEVNDRFCINRDYIINCKVETYNQDTPQQFNAVYPTDYQIRKAFGISCKINTDGDDINIYVNRDSDYYPIGEMLCTSHDCLSPIKDQITVTKESNNKAYYQYRKNFHCN